ncbi:MAG: TfoX/Sxy family protein [Saprospiraceae bacterium]
MKNTDSGSLRGAMNIGPTIERRLREIGVFTLADLADMTPAAAYRKICERHPDKTIPVCYYLYSLQGAQLGLHWDDLPPELKRELREQVDLYTP